MRKKRPELKYFSEVLSKLLDEWKEKNPGKTQADFAELVGVATPNSVSDWKCGYTPPTKDNMKKICEILGVDDSVFSPKLDDEKYLYERKRISEIGDDNLSFALDRGLNLSTIIALRDLVDFDERFPKYSPICPGKSGVYTRQENADSASIDKDLKFLQIKRAGKTYTMHKVDLMYLKEVQDQIAYFVEYLFYKRAREMEEEVKAFNEDLKAPPIVGIAHSDEAKNKHTFTPLYQDIQDKYLDITNDENLLKPENEDKLIKAIEDLVDICPGDAIEIRYPKVDIEYILSHDRFARYFESKATQEDIDSYFGHSKKRSDKNG